MANGDTVDLTNLQRQILHTQDRIGQSKAKSGKAALPCINPETRVDAISEQRTGEKLHALIAKADIVLNCCENFATRHAVNRACVRNHRSLVSGAAIRFSGQLSVFDNRQIDSPCYHCLFPEGEDIQETRCAVMGVFAPLTGIIAPCKPLQINCKAYKSQKTEICARLDLVFDIERTVIVCYNNSD